MILLVLFILGVRTFAYEPYSIPAASMKPTLEVGDKIIVSKMGYGNYDLFGKDILTTSVTAEVNRGDVIVFDYPRNPDVQYIKRIIGLPDDHIKIADGTLYINQKPVETIKHSEDNDLFYFTEQLGDTSHQIARLKQNKRTADMDLTVPEQAYFVMGDNRDNSNDSRYWGFVPEANLVGKLVHVFSDKK